jgi:hypothetical protein
MDILSLSSETTVSGESITIWFTIEEGRLNFDYPENQLC